MAKSTGNTPIHPLRLCKEVRDFIDRNRVLVVDGEEILNFGRQSIPTFSLRHCINSGTFGTMGVGMPFAVGAKVAGRHAVESLNPVCANMRSISKIWTLRIG